MSTPVIHWAGSLAPLLDPGYPKLKKARNLWTLTLKYHGPYETLKAQQPAYGNVGLGDSAGYMVQESELYKEGSPPAGVLDVVCTKGVPDPGDNETTVPPPKPDIKMVRIDLPIEKNPYFADIFTDPDYADSMMSAVQSALQATTPTERENAKRRFEDDALVQEFYDKKRKGEDNFIAFYPHATLTICSTSCPSSLNKGGVIEAPNSLIPYPQGYTWLRMGDELTKSTQYWELVKQWIGGEDIDADMYSSTATLRKIASIIQRRKAELAARSSRSSKS